MRAKLIRAAGALIIALPCSGCKGKDASADAPASFLAGASPEAQEAVATPVNFQLTEDNFNRWEIAQQNLDRLPPAALASAQPSSGSVIDRAVARLNGSARAKRAIESAGLSVRDFVLETIALAQATEAANSGRSSLRSSVSAANFAFVERYRDRIRRAGIAAELALQSGDTAITDPNTAAELARASSDSATAAAIGDSIGAGEASTGRPAHVRRDTMRDTLRDSIP